MKNFSDFKLPQELQTTIAKLGFVTPTPIQLEAIPAALEGRDILGSAQTGTGKTLAFVLPIITKLMESQNETALILTPTRELAKQVFDCANQLLERSKIRAALLIGGAPIFLQLRQLNMGARLIVGTPGRVNDHLGRNEMLLKNTKFLVLDETDLMLDMGFSEQINDILEYMPPKKQTLLFSATLPDQILKLSEKYLNNPQRIAIGKVTNVATNIVEDMVYTTREGKYDELVKALDNKTGTIIVFVKTKMDAEAVAKKLQKEKHKVDFLHGGLRQSRRDRVTKMFRNKGFRIMIATDVAARGLDIPHIEHVINYDMPETHEDYIHRIGRTARAEASGCALSLITSKNRVNNIKEFFEIGRGKPTRSSGGNRGGSRGGFGGQRRSSGFGGSRNSSGSRSRSPFGRFSDNEAPRSEGRKFNHEASSTGFADRAPRNEYRSENRGGYAGTPRSGSRFSDNDASRGENRGGYEGSNTRSGGRFSERGPRSEFSSSRGEFGGEYRGGDARRSTGSNDSNSFSRPRSTGTRKFGSNQPASTTGNSYRRSSKRSND